MESIIITASSLLTASGFFILLSFIKIYKLRNEIKFAYDNLNDLLKKFEGKVSQLQSINNNIDEFSKVIMAILSAYKELREEQDKSQQQPAQHDTSKAFKKKIPTTEKRKPGRPKRVKA